MAIKLRLDPIATTLRVMVEKDASVPAQQRAIANFARAEITKADDINRRALGRVPEKEITVDGRAGAALESVKPNGGRIVVEWEIFTDVLVWIAAELRKRSPRISGAYIASHTLFADGTEVNPSAGLPPAKEFTFLNLVPYSRKIEIGKTKAGRAFVIQVPNRIYERVAQDARSRFGNSADIRFVYRETTNAYRVRGRRGGTRALRAPAIIVKIKGS